MDVKQCDNEGCNRTFRETDLGWFRLERDPFGGGGRALGQWEQNLDLCSAECLEAVAVIYAGGEREAEAYRAQAKTDGVTL